MSLNRAQWEDMWENIKKVEKLAYRLPSAIERQRLLNIVERIKNQIQSVIGQME